jgi:lysine/ornithine N-monooxygenase
VSTVAVAIIGAGPYGLSVAAHLAALGVEHRVFGRPMQFWSQIASAGNRRYLKSYCFGTNISTPVPGYSFADYSKPRGLETFEPCSIGDFADYGRWFQQHNVSHVEPVEVVRVERAAGDFLVVLDNGSRIRAARVVVATGLSYFASVPSVLASLPPGATTHTSKIDAFSSFRNRHVAVIGAGQSALEAAALLLEVGAKPQLLVRDPAIRWHHRVSLQRSLWRRLRSPISGLGTGPKAWALTHFPGAMHRLPSAWRTRFVKAHLPAEGAWWLRERVEGKLPVHLDSTIVAARDDGGQLILDVAGSTRGNHREMTFDHVIAGSGYDIDVDRIDFLDPTLRAAIRRVERAPRLNAKFEASVAGLHFVGPTSSMSFGPLFRFVVGADYTARVVAEHLSRQVARPGAA